MKISISWLAEYLEDASKLLADPKAVFAELTKRGLEVEAVQDLAKGFAKVVVAQIETRDRHPNADRLSVCKVNNGKEVLQIVCGAQNMKAGDKIALAMVGADLPNGLKIAKSKIRDVESMGMLCSETELGLADTSEGILILPTDAQVGLALADYLQRNDVVFTLNITPNRGDALSHIGVAREIAAILKTKLKLPALKLKEGSVATSNKIKVNVSAKAKVLQYQARYIENVSIKPSPEWLQRKLTAIGLRPINNIVDVTNYILFELGQPLHAFDYQKIAGSEIHVRLAKSQESIPLLDGSTIHLNENDLVIADAQKPVALAGVMGGANSEVSASTTCILLEAAQFDSATVRVAAKSHQKHTDSSHRFERQIDGAQLSFALDRAAELMASLAGGQVAATPVKITTEIFNAKNQTKRILLSVTQTNQRLGTSLTAKAMTQCLQEIGFKVSEKDDLLNVEVPSYRPDVALVEDLQEEILRVWGYDQVAAVVPALAFIPEPVTASDRRFEQIERVKKILAAAGFNEVVNYAFTSQTKNQQWGGLLNNQSVALANPLNEEFTTLKTSLLSGLIDNLVASSNFQQKNLRLFEVRPVFIKDSKSETNVREEWMVAGIAQGRAYAHSLEASDREFDFYDLKAVLETVIEAIGCRGFRWQALPEHLATDPRLHPAQAASVVIGKGSCGVMARLHPKAEADLKIRQKTYWFEFSLDQALQVSSLERKFSALNRFPKVERAFSLIVPQNLNADQVTQCLLKLGKPLVERVQVVDRYVGDKIPAGNSSLSVQFWLYDPNQTLEEKAVDLTCQKILDGLAKELGVKLRLH